MNERIIIVGYRSEAAENLWDLIPEPEPTTTRTKPESIAEWKQTMYPAEKRALKERVAAQAANMKLLGRITHVAAYNVPARQHVEYHYDGAGVDFVSWLQASDYDPQRVSICGFNAKPLMRISCIQAIQMGIPVRLNYWYKNDEVYDPYDMLTEAENRQYLPLPKALTLFDCLVADDYTLHADAIKDLQLAAEVLFKMGLTDRGDQASIREAFKTPGAASPTKPKKSKAKA